MEVAQESRQLAQAFKGELRAIAHILELRNYQKGLRAIAARCLEEQQVFIYSVTAREEYRTIYKANASRIGCLSGTLPEQIAIFYTLASSLLEDFSVSAEIKTGKRSADILGNPTQVGQRYLALADYIDELISKATIAISEIDRLYPSNAKPTT